MKNIILVSSFFLTFSALADIEYVAGDRSIATDAEISKSRACFQELSVQGCGDPGEDPQQFRSCMSNVYPTLNPDCQKLMTELYGKK